MKVCYVKLEEKKLESVWTNHTQHTSGWVLQGLPCRMWSHPCRNSKAWKQLWSVSTNHLGSRYQILSSPMFKVQSNESTMSKHCSHNYFPQQACLVSRKWIEWSAMPHIELKLANQFVFLIYMLLLLRNLASNFHWLSSSIFNVRCSLFVPHPWHFLSSPLYDVSDHTNHIFSVRIWSWQHVSVNMYSLLSWAQFTVV